MWRLPCARSPLTWGHKAPATSERTVGPRTSRSVGAADRWVQGRCAPVLRAGPFVKELQANADRPPHRSKEIAVSLRTRSYVTIVPFANKCPLRATNRQQSISTLVRDVVYGQLRLVGLGADLPRRIG